MSELKRYKLTVLDESLTTHGFWVSLSGLEFELYMRNPVVLREHWGSVVGRCERVWIEDRKLKAEIVFDMADAEAAALAGKVERNFIRMVSAGLEPLVWSESPEDLKPGQTCQTLLKSRLREISIVVFGANQNAFVEQSDSPFAVQLYDENNNKINLSADNATLPAITKKGETMNKEVIELLNLEEGASLTSISTAIRNMHTELCGEREKTVNMGAQLEIYKAKEMEQRQKTLERLMTEKQFSDLQKDNFRKLATQNFDITLKTLHEMPDPINLSDYTAGDNAPKRSALDEEIDKLK